MNVVIGGLYQHYKGDLYRVIGIANHSETLEKLVIYQAQHNSPEFGDKAMWARPEGMFLETIEYQGVQKPRFTLVPE